ncbi:MAG TPA: DUF1080 domain-containing protein [Verrucomicrobiales bacterium]|nr:DUF1080 domain-containing protein [Verrucomicrobiales bacterium]
MALVLVTAAGCQTKAPQSRYVKIFDGKTFAGWDGDTEKTWRIEDGAFVGGSLKENVPHNEFLATTRQFTNFVLRLQFKLEGAEGFINAGVQVRSQRKPDHFEMIGYQVDMGDPSWWGSIYDETRRNKVLAQSDMSQINRILRRNDWNQYEIRCEGKRVRAYINGLLTVDYTEPDDSIPQFGKIGLQVHGGGKALVSYRDIYVMELP